jgi:hypothetical protein
MFNVGDLITAKIIVSWDDQTQWKMAIVREVTPSKIVVQLAGFGGMEGIEDWILAGTMYAGQTKSTCPRSMRATKRWPDRTRYTILEIL